MVPGSICDEQHVELRLGIVVSCRRRLAEGFHSCTSSKRFWQSAVGGAN